MIYRDNWAETELARRNGGRLNASAAANSNNTSSSANYSSSTSGYEYDFYRKAVQVAQTRLGGKDTGIYKPQNKTISAPEGGFVNAISQERGGVRRSPADKARDLEIRKDETDVYRKVEKALQRAMNDVLLGKETINMRDYLPAGVDPQVIEQVAAKMKNRVDMARSSAGIGPGRAPAVRSR